MNNSSKKPKILAVDDTEENLIVLENILFELPIEIIKASSGEEALKLSLDHEFLLVLLDVQMPEMDGYEVAELLGINEFSKNTPIIFITANFTNESNKLKGYRSGAIDYLTKPIIKEILVSKIKVFLELYNEREKYKELQISYQHIAMYDHLTQLPNRRLYDEFFNQAIKRSKRESYKFSLLFLDVDHFKGINDNLGHNIGDELLKKIAHRIPLCLRKSDLFARIGGDEFSIILEDIKDHSNAADIAKNIIKSLQFPFHIDHHELFISISIGIASYPDSAKDSINLRKNADIALYHAKQLGRNTYFFYNAEISEKSTRRSQLINDLQMAMQRKQLYFHYQPKYSLPSKNFIGVEALMRWDHPKLGCIPPEEFIVLAEESGLINSLGEWAFLHICKQIKEWETFYQFSTLVAINLSSAQLLQKKFIDTIEKIIKNTQVNPKQLEFEITETALMENKKNTLHQLNILNKMGIAISIDGFCAGHSSLTCLHQLPVNYLKINGSFISHLFDKHSSAPIVKAIISLAHNLKLKVVGEGVETEDQFTFLQENVCDYVQGHFFSKPLSPDLIITLHSKKDRITYQGSSD